jgi:hypothetical protein
MAQMTGPMTVPINLIFAFLRVIALTRLILVTIVSSPLNVAGGLLAGLVFDWIELGHLPPRLLIGQMVVVSHHFTILVTQPTHNHAF